MAKALLVKSLRNEVVGCSIVDTWTTYLQLIFRFKGKEIPALLLRIGADPSFSAYLLLARAAQLVQGGLVAVVGDEASVVAL